jgi:hypothetical protein
MPTPRPVPLTPHRGRPRKFARPSRPVTLTLPDDVIAALQSVDHDLSRAVVRVAQPHLGKRPHPPAEIAAFGRRGVIVVNPSRILERRTGVTLVPLSDGRALMAFDESVSIERLELDLRDAVAEDGLSREDARIFKSVAELLKSARQTDRLSLRQRKIIVLESKRPVRRRNGRAV